MEHVRRRHVLQGVVMRFLTVQGLQMIFSGDASNVDWADYFLNMSFTRNQEAEADEGALRRLQKAHVDNQGFKDFFQRMEKQVSVPAFLSDHPADEDRYEMANGFANENVKPIMSHENWLLLKHFCR
jgi:beta-barrel assembly-enhancing protease